MATPFRSADGTVVGSVSVIRDLSARKRAEELALRSSRLESTATLAGGIAHDFNNLMTVSLGHAELLRRRLGGSPEAAGSLTAIVEAGREAARLSQQLLAFARGGKYVVSPVDLNGIVRSAKRDTVRPRVEVVTCLADDLWRVMADASQMRQMVENLLANAVEAIPDGGLVSIATDNIQPDDALLRGIPELKPAHHVRLAVEDDGCGMDAATLARAFEPFFSTRGPGRGLGLAAAYGITKNQGGVIRGFSRPGSGSLFEVFLPAMAPEAAAAVAEPAVAARSVLVVESADAAARLAETVLSERGYRVSVVRDAERAAALLRDAGHPVDLVLLALPAPPCSGAAGAFQLLRAARPGVRILLCGGGGLEPAVEELLKAGAAAFLGKPYRVEELSRAVRQIIGD